MSHTNINRKASKKETKTRTAAMDLTRIIDSPSPYPEKICKEISNLSPTTDPNADDKLSIVSKAWLLGTEALWEVGQPPDYWALENIGMPVKQPKGTGIWPEGNGTMTTQYGQVFWTPYRAWCENHDRRCETWRLAGQTIWIGDLTGSAPIALWEWVLTHNLWPWRAEEQTHTQLTIWRQALNSGLQWHQQCQMALLLQFTNRPANWERWEAISNWISQLPANVQKHMGPTIQQKLNAFQKEPIANQIPGWKQMAIQHGAKCGFTIDSNMLARLL